MSQSFEKIYMHIYIMATGAQSLSLEKGRINVNQHTILSFAPSKWYGILVPLQTFFTPWMILSRGKWQFSQWIKKRCKTNLKCSKTSYPVGPKTSKQTLHGPEKSPWGLRKWIWGMMARYTTWAHRDHVCHQAYNFHFSCQEIYVTYHPCLVRRPVYVILHCRTCVRV